MRSGQGTNYGERVALSMAMRITCRVESSVLKL